MGDIALFGGTFNPVHTGHTEMASAVSELDFIEKIIVMPTFVPPHKAAPDLAPEGDRLNMCRIAFGGIPKCEVSDLEIKRRGKSYTVLTVRALKKLYRDQKIYIVCGGDMAVSLKTWYRYKELRKKASFILLSRGGTGETEFENAVKELKEDGADVFVLKKEITAVSSTEIRADVGASAENSLLPRSVYEYITGHKLYGKE